MKKVMIILIFIALLVLLTACHAPKKGKVLHAKIRYFDGTAEMIPLESYYSHIGCVRLNTAYGDKMWVGWNNVIIIEEDADRE